ncbi:MAG: DUF3754 domain-containing protein [Hyphomonadaceae bacterium]|nr:DUF3754 domain-containing protein [Hyphomonadaceae bacterium]
MMGARSDGFIPVRKGELAAALLSDSRLPPGIAGPLENVFSLLRALLRHEAQAPLDRLHGLYDPLDPDAPPVRRDLSLQAFERFEGALVTALQRANFTEVGAESVQSMQATAKLTGLSIKPSAAGIRRVRYFSRGVRQESTTFKSWFGLSKRTLDYPVMSDVVVLVGFKAENEIQREDLRAFARMRRGVRPGAALIKHFRNVAAPELVTLHPGARPSMRTRDQVFLAAPAIATGVPVLLNIWPAVTVLFAVLAAYFGAQGVIEESELKRALAAVSGLVAVGAFVMRQRLKYEAQTLRYQKRLADTVYFRNLANNAGVIDLLIGAGEEQDSKEAMLAYFTLLCAGRPMAKSEIDASIESYLRERFGFAIDFEIGDALEKVARLGLIVSDEGGAYKSLGPTEALAHLDRAWDDLFRFSERR